MGDSEIIESSENFILQIQKLEFLPMNLNESVGGVFCYIVW